jgi:hypothetical protein
VLGLGLKMFYYKMLWTTKKNIISAIRLIRRLAVDSYRGKMVERTRTILSDGNKFVRP